MARALDFEVQAYFSGLYQSDQWNGHKEAHIGVPISQSTTLHGLKQDLLNYLLQCDVSGSTLLADRLRGEPGGDSYDELVNDALYEATKLAIERIVVKGGTDHDSLFDFYQISSAGSEDVYAWFLFKLVSGQIN